MISAQNMQTFSLARPAGRAFWRDATCDEVDCPRQRNGWRTVLDTSTVDGQGLAKWITDRSGRAYSMVTGPGPVVTFTFSAGQRCFERHTMAIEREPLYIARNRAGRVQHPRGELWVEHSQEELDKVRKDIEG